MRTELRVTLPGPEGAADAGRALAVLRRLLDLLGQVEDAAVDDDTRRHGRTTWGFTGLALGSLTATLAPNRPRTGLDSTTLAEVARTTVDGLAIAEERPGLPPRWARRSATAGADLAQLLGLLPADGLTVELLDGGAVVRTAVITRQAEEHLRAGLRTDDRSQSIGSVIGRLDTASLHEKREAGLWLERTHERVTVIFGPSQIEAVRQAWGRRVEIAGRLVRDADGRVLSVRLRTLEILPDAEDTPALTDLVGLDPTFTGGVDPDDYLGMIRGAS